MAIGFILIPVSFSPDIVIEKSKPEGVWPTRGYEQDAGLDLHIPENVKLPAKKWTPIDLYIRFYLPTNMYGLILSRSSTVFANLIVHVGLIDTSFYGSISLLVYNLNEFEIELIRGRRLAQIVFQKYEVVRFRLKAGDVYYEEDHDDDDSDNVVDVKRHCLGLRNEAKFGSSGL